MLNLRNSPHLQSDRLRADLLDEGLNLLGHHDVAINRQLCEQQVDTSTSLQLGLCRNPL